MLDFLESNLSPPLPKPEQEYLTLQLLLPGTFTYCLLNCRILHQALPVLLIWEMKVVRALEGI